MRILKPCSWLTRLSRIHKSSWAPIRRQQQASPDIPIKSVTGVRHHGAILFPCLATVTSIIHETGEVELGPRNFQLSDTTRSHVYIAHQARFSALNPPTSHRNHSKFSACLPSRSHSTTTHQSRNHSYGATQRRSPSRTTLN